MKKKIRYRTVPVHAMKSVLDGVPSMHDAKSCTLIAHLHAQGISSRWEDKEEFEHEMRTLVDEREMFAKPEERGCGQLEAYLARHFPELAELVDWSCSWYLHLLARFPSPAHIAAAPEEAKQCLHRAARGRLACADEVVERARNSLGVPVTEREAILVAAFADYLLDLRRRLRDVDRRIRAAVKHRPEIASMVKTLGPTTTAVLFADAGDPAKYSSTAAYEKALGLNLKERSSGEYVSPLRITKRGPRRARKVLFLAALRLIKDNDDSTHRERCRAHKPIVGILVLARGPHSRTLDVRRPREACDVGRGTWDVGRGTWDVHVSSTRRCGATMDASRS